MGRLHFLHRLTAGASLLLACTSALAQSHLRFVVTGDDRWETKTPRDGMDENGVNVAAMKRLATAIVAEKPTILLFNGDTIGGGDDAQEASQYKTFMTAMKPIYDAKIKVLAVRGNHEMHAPHADDLWRSTFSGPFANPATGPTGEEDFTFSYETGDVLFLGLDEFMTKKPVINQAWLDGVLAKTKATHIFAFAHKMAFVAGHHVDGMNTIPEARDRFLESLEKAGGVTVFFGHDHLYDHLKASEAGWPTGKAIHQVVVGTAGAPFAHGTSSQATDGNWTLAHLGHVEGKLGYCVVDVDGSKVTVTFKAETSPGVFERADSFAYEVAAKR
ncbi:MAG TPA: metallophosphoesterase [Fimbriimonadaceae bacterium]|nr:metallophosphoesterase [Fimbriimonadaceae bacterium]